MRGRLSELECGFRGSSHRPDRLRGGKGDTACFVQYNTRLDDMSIGLLGARGLGPGWTWD